MGPVTPSSLLSTWPLKTRHAHLGYVQVTLALVLHDRLDGLQYGLDGAGGDDNANLVIEEHVLFARLVLWKPLSDAYYNFLAPQRVL